jgi:phage gp36-like protein
LTDTGAFTLKRLRLNRSPLVAYRLRKRRQTEQIRLLARYREMIRLLEQLNIQLSVHTEEQRQLLEEQRELLRLLLRARE